MVSIAEVSIINTSDFNVSSHITLPYRTCVPNFIWWFHN